MQDVRTHLGTLIGFEVTSLFLERVGNFGPELLAETVKVMMLATKPLPA
jgi:hypothetical protein